MTQMHRAKTQPRNPKYSAVPINCRSGGPETSGLRLPQFHRVFYLLLLSRNLARFPGSSNDSQRETTGRFFLAS